MPHTSSLVHSYGRVGLSYADLYTLAGAVSVEALGGIFIR